MAGGVRRARRFRQQGGTVILITNAPRPGTVVQALLDQLKSRAPPMTASSARAT